MDFYEQMLAFSQQVQRLGFFLWTWVFGIILIAAGVYFTIRTRGAQFTLMGDVGRIFRRKRSVEKEAGVTDDGTFQAAVPDGNLATDQRKPENSLSAFQSFAISETSRVGTGNIVGVAVAIAMGGAGAIFWMWVMALFSACTNLIESILGQVYKENAGDRFMGGPMYYFQRAFRSKVPAYVFAILLSFLYVFIWNSVQTNTIVDTFQGRAPSRLVVGLIIAALIALIIFGGMKRIVQVASTLLPAMVVLFLLVGTVIIFMHLPDFFRAFGHIVTSAFGTQQVVGGAVGFTLGQALQQGLRRGIFSNEAGIGSKPIGAATSDVSHPAKQAIIYAFGVFVDTLWISSITAFLVLMSPYYGTGATGIALVRDSIIHFTGPIGLPFFYLLFFILPFTSVVGNYFYGETCLRFATQNPRAIPIFRIIAVGVIILASLVPLNLVWNLADIFTGTLMTLNVIVLFKLSNVAIAVLNDYKRQRAAMATTGQEPVFYDDNIGIDTPYWKRDRPLDFG